MQRNTIEDLNLFNKVIQEQIERLKIGKTLQFEIGVLEDLSRMAALGVFTVYTSSPNDFEINLNGTEFTAICRVPRMMFTGEKRIIDLENENELLKKKIHELSNTM